METNSTKEALKGVYLTKAEQEQVAQIEAATSQIRPTCADDAMFKRMGNAFNACSMAPQYFALHTYLRDALADFGSVVMENAALRADLQTALKVQQELITEMIRLAADPRKDASASASLRPWNTVIPCEAEKADQKVDKSQVLMHSEIDRLSAKAAQECKTPADQAIIQKQKQMRQKLEEVLSLMGA